MPRRVPVATRVFIPASPPLSAAAGQVCGQGVVITAALPVMNDRHAVA